MQQIRSLIKIFLLHLIMRHSLTLEIPTDFSAECKQILTPRSPRSSQEILIRVSDLHQILAAFKANSVTQKQIIENVQNKSVMLKRRKSQHQIYKEVNIPRQMQNLNKIKQNNERILKGRIKYLEQKLKKQESIPTGPNHNEIRELQQKLQESKRTIKKMQQEIKRIMSNIKFVQQENTRLNKQNNQLKITIQKIPRPNPLVNSFIQTNPVRLTDTWIQTERYSHFLVGKLTQTQTKFNSKFNFHSVLDHIILPSPSPNFEVQNLQLVVQALESSNSSLRKELVRHHAFMDEQDEKYKQNLEKLEQKIKKLTVFDQLRRSRNRMPENQYELWDSPLRKSSGFGLKRISDFDFSKQGQKQKMSASQIVQVADLKIKLELSKNNSPKKASEQDSKLTVASGLTQSHQ